MEFSRSVHEKTHIIRSVCLKKEIEKKKAKQISARGTNKVDMTPSFL